MRGPKAYCCRESILKHILAASPNETPAKKAAFVQKGGNTHTGARHSDQAGVGRLRQRNGVDHE